MNWEANKNLKEFLSKMGIVVDARATSDSGRWVVLLGSHLKDGMPTFVVLAIRSTDFLVDLHRFDPVNSDKSSYDECRDQAQKAARRFYEDLVMKLTTRRQTSEESDEDSGLEIQNPDGTTERYSIN